MRISKSMASIPRKHHKFEGQEDVICSPCGKKFCKSRDLKKHMFETHLTVSQNKHHNKAKTILGTNSKIKQKLTTLVQMGNITISRSSSTPNGNTTIQHGLKQKLTSLANAGNITLSRTNTKPFTTKNSTKNMVDKNKGFVNISIINNVQKDKTQENVNGNYVKHTVV